MSTEKPHIGNESQHFIPLLTTTDWNEEWIELQKARHSIDDSSVWDKKAKNYNKPFGHSPYANKFIELTDIESSDSVFDMGCGTGAITIPLAKDGHEVCAADFSRGMLDRLEEDAIIEGVEGIKVVRLAWDDDWSACGVEPNSYDVAIASRSIATSDLKDALLKLSSVARRRCAITLSAGSSPRADQRILSEIGIQPYIGRDFLYAFMILTDLDYLPIVRYIESERHDSFSSEKDAYDSLKKMVLDVSHMVSDKELDSALSKLEDWVKENLVENPDAGNVNDREELEKEYILKSPRKITWAHISWDLHQ